MAQITDVLTELNPWWRGPFQLTYHERDLHARLRPFLGQPQVLAFTGLRRVGKTTLMLRLIQEAIQNGQDPRTILYFSFDDWGQIRIREVLTSFATLLQHDLSEGRYLIALDEVQKLSGWDEQLKALYDARKNIRWLISGSESLFLRHRSRATLAGRLFDFRVDPLTFREYLRFRSLPHEPLGLYETDLRRQLLPFARTCGFPELAGGRQKPFVKAYLAESIVEKILYRDIPTRYGVKDTETLHKILRLLMDEPGQLVELSSMAQGLGVTRQTVATYLACLEDAFLVRKLYNYSRNRRKVERKLRKYYPTVASPDLLFRDDALSHSRVFEWLLIMQLQPEFFWRDEHAREVDAVLVDPAVHPVEIKFGRVETAGVWAFMRRFQVKEGMVVTWDQEGAMEKDGGRIQLLPAVRFLLSTPARS